MKAIVLRDYNIPAGVEEQSDEVIKDTFEVTQSNLHRIWQALYCIQKESADGEMNQSVLMCISDAMRSLNTANSYITEILCNHRDQGCE